MSGNTPVDEQTRCRDLTGQVIRDDAYFAYGGFSEIYHGTWTDPSTGIPNNVAVKILRGIHTNDELLKLTIKRLNRETRVWQQLEHKNVLPFLGICHDIGPSPALISPFCEAGNLAVYVSMADSKVVRFPLLLGIADGLCYLHSQDVVHGDMKAQNVLIDETGSPRLCDFGRSKIIDERGFTTALTGTARFMAPELLGVPDEQEGIADGEALPEPPAPQLTKESDVYGFSMVALQSMTSKPPFHNIHRDATVMIRVSEGKRPEIGSYKNPPSVPVWEILETCWHQGPKSRPTMQVVVERLSELDQSQL